MIKSCSASPATRGSVFLPRSAGLAALLCAVLAAGCGADDEGGDTAVVATPPADTLSCAAVAASGAVTVCGTATFVSVPNNPATGALTYTGATAKPIRGATAELLNAAGATVATTVTDDTGAYTFVATGTTGDLRVRVRAELKKTSGGGGQWDFRVRDNTSGNALYVLDSPAVAPVAGGVVQRNVKAESGFDGSRYSATRAAGPFAVLDVVFDAAKKVLSASPEQVFPPLTLFWSTRNAPATGADGDLDVTAGLIGTSFYTFSSAFGGHVLFLLGQENVDTDEYDSHVVAHEWGHYFQSAFSRDDSLGGSHTLGDKLDMRVAFSEGWGNAWSGMALGSPIYADSGGTGQASGFTINVSQSPAANDQGWYSESSVQFLMFSFHEAATVGFKPIFNVMTGSLKQSPAFTSMHSFATLLKTAAPGGATAINTLLKGQQISQVNDVFGAAETNSGGISVALPIYQADTGTHCVTTEAVAADDTSAPSNKLGSTSFIKFTTAAAGTRTLTLKSVTGQTGSDPDFVVTASDGSQQLAESLDLDTETATIDLPAGTHTLALLDFNLAFNTAGKTCFNLTVQ